MDMTGEKIGKLRVIEFSHTDKGKQWKCQCECGHQSIKNTSQLNEAKKTGKNVGCRCAKKASIVKAVTAAKRKNTTHGLSHSKLSNMYDNMMKRCYRPATNRYDRYGGRGINVCKDWREDRNHFYQWALNHGYQEGLSIDRIDIDGHYCPDNCRFIPKSKQQSNTSRNRFLVWNRKKQTVSDWAREIGVRPQALQHRISRGWSTERIFTQPFRGRN